MGNQEWTIQRHWQHWVHKTSPTCMENATLIKHISKIAAAMNEQFLGVVLDDLL